METLTLEQFGAKIKQKYPTYVNYSDAEIGQKMIEKYPEYKTRIQASPTTASAPQQAEFPSITDSATGSFPVIKQLTEAGVGIGTAVGKAGLNLGKSFVKLSQGIADLGTKVIGAPKQDYSAISQGIDTISNNLFQKPFEKELGTIPGKIGNVVGAAAPYVETGGGVSKLGNIASNSVAGAGAVARVAAGAGAEAAANFGLGYGLSGGDKKQALIQAATAGFLKTLTGTVGELANKTKTPESLVTHIFRTTKKEELAAFNSPKDSIAKQALDRGIAGDTPKIARTLTTGMADSEAKIAEEFAKAGNPKVVLDNPETIISYIQDKANLLRKSGAIKEAAGLEASLPAINPATGEISANNALALRRFLDGLRIEKGFMAPTEELSAQQAGLKEMADEIRHKINAIGGTGEAMKDYSFFIKAMDKLAAHASRTKNADALGIINTFLLGESVANNNPVLAGVAIGRRILQTTSGATKLAQFLKNLPQSSPAGATTRSLAGALVK
jgi:hypothetical protein